ncbi:MAG: hypothetical protein ACMXYB_02595 [Candidatus Woesearchaeota archaeon]
MRGAPHLELREYIRNPDFDIRQLFEEFGFSSFTFSTHPNFKERFKELFEEIDSFGLGGAILGTSKNFSYICSYREAEFEKPFLTEFYTPQGRRYRQKGFNSCSSVDTLCTRLLEQADDKLAIRRIDFQKAPLLMLESPHVVDEFSRNIDFLAGFRAVYDNKGRVKVNGLVPRITIEEEYFN